MLVRLGSKMLVTRTLTWLWFTRSWKWIRLPLLPLCRFKTTSRDGINSWWSCNFIRSLPHFISLERNNVNLTQGRLTISLLHATFATSLGSSCHHLPFNTQAKHAWAVIALNVLVTHICTCPALRALETRHEFAPTTESRIPAPSAFSSSNYNAFCMH